MGGKSALQKRTPAYRPDDRGIDAALSNFQPSQFVRWRRALAAVRLGIADAKILVIGDSTAAGIGGSSAATVPQNKSWPAQLAALMNSFMVPTARGLAVPRSRGTSQTADTRWTNGTGWALNTQTSQQAQGFGGYGSFWASATASTSLVFAEPAVTADTFDVYYQLVPGSGTLGSFTATATGGSGTTVNTAAGSGSPSIGKVTVAAAAPGTANSVTIAHDATTKVVSIVGVEPSLSTTRQVRVGNAGVSGTETANWTAYASGNSANTWGGLDSIKAYGPHLSIIDLGINDAGVSLPDAATYLGRMQQIIAAAKVSGDVILKTMVPSDPGGTPNRVPLETQYVAALKSAGVPLVDAFGRIGAFSSYSTFMNDTLHPNDYGYADQAALMFEALRRV